MTTTWTATVRDQTLVVAFPVLFQVLSWAPLHGGFGQARTIINHHVPTNDAPIHEPEIFLQLRADRLALETPVVGLMTGVKMERLVRRTVQDEGLHLECFATVGLSNALAIGDPATYDEQPGTINLIVVVNQPLSAAALVEGVEMVTEAKVRALYTSGVKSTVSDAFATGTGTDCVAIACPIGAPAYRYCGKHTRLGEVLGQVVGEAVTTGLQRAREP
jgi:adenosylcobinamide hydrolase